MQLPSDVGRMLGTVYATAVRGTEADTRASALRGIGDRYAVYGPGDHSILFQGDALRTAEGMVDALTGSALTDGGFAPDSLRRHIADACRAATVDDAIARLTQLLAEEPVEYTLSMSRGLLK